MAGDLMADESSSNEAPTPNASASRHSERSKADATASAATSHDGPESVASAKEAFSVAGDRFRELKSHLSYAAEVKLDQVKAAVRSALIFTLLGIVAAIAAAGLVVTAVVLLCMGIASAITALTHSVWIGDITAAVLILGGVVLAVYIGINRLTKASYANMVKKYESRRREQKSEFGHDVGDRAAAQRAHSTGKAPN
jgi:hypothetical protein